MTPFDKSRYDWYRDTPEVVLNSDGNPRPALPVPLNTFTVHYGGAGSNWTDFGDTADELWGVELWARSQSKPNEYNSSSDSQAVTWEYAGPFLAAHSGGENMSAWGHLALYGLEQLTEIEAQAFIKGTRKARQQCVDAGYLTPGHEVVAHNDMPGADTSCPGPLYTNKRWWNQIIAPLTEQEPVAMETQFVWRHRSQPGAYWVMGGSVVHLDAVMRDNLISKGVLEVVSDNDDVADSYRAVAQGIPR